MYHITPQDIDVCPFCGSEDCLWTCEESSKLEDERRVCEDCGEEMHEDGLCMVCEFAEQY